MIVPCHSDYGHPEHRRFQRVDLRLSGRYMLASRKEYPCRTINISPGGALLTFQEKPEIGEPVVLYLDALGRFSGRAVRVVGDGFAMTLDLSKPKRQRLADQLTWFASHNNFGCAERRRNERVVPIMQKAVMRLPNGEQCVVKVRDLSASGVAIEARRAPELGVPVDIGNTPVTVARHFDGGFAGEFIVPFREGEIDELTRL